MDIKELFNGVAVVIDDEVNYPNANINEIIGQIESANIPVLKYTSLPKADIVNHFQNLSFLLLDWRLIKDNVSNSELEEGVKMPEGIQEYDATENLEFIENLNQNCFCPVFIFTNEDTSFIENKLKDKKLMADGRPSNLLVLSKSDLQDKGTLFNKVSEWLEKNPSIYVLKEWEKEYQICKTKLFLEFHSINPSWPAVMWKNFKDDGANQSLEMGELISRNLHSRMTPFKFNEKILENKTNIPMDELRKVLEGERYLKNESLHATNISTGDLFKVEKKCQDNEQTETRYYLNIRAQCDLIRETNVELYIIAGYELEQNAKGKIKDISFCHGQYLEKPNHAVIAFLDGGKIIEFKFSEFKIKKWDELKDLRIGRLLPPYINRIQQRYALYMQRQGLPRMPREAIGLPPQK